MEELRGGPRIVLSARDAERVRRGAPELELGRLRGSAELFAGRAALLLDPRQRPLGAGIADPARGVFRVWSRRPLPTFDQAFFRSRIEAALSRRAGLFPTPDTDAYRLLHGDGEGLSGFAVDAWGGFLVLQAFGPGPAAWAEEVERALWELVRPRGIVRKQVFPEAPGQGASLERGKVEEAVLGERPPEPLLVREDGIPFAVRLLGARHPGLFTDMREERRRLCGLASGLCVLNTFAYTGGFSVAAARGGAREVVSVDVVAKVLERAKENFRLSGIDPALHRFVRMEVMEHLALARKRGLQFDAIVLDPPTFASGKSGRWSLERDYPALLLAALSVLAPGGYLWVCANAAGVRRSEVERWISAASGSARRPLSTVARAGQPPDYPAPPGFPRYRYLKVEVLRG